MIYIGDIYQANPGINKKEESLGTFLRCI